MADDATDWWLGALNLTATFESDEVPKDIRQKIVIRLQAVTGHTAAYFFRAAVVDNRFSFTRGAIITGFYLAYQPRNLTLRVAQSLGDELALQIQETVVPLFARCDLEATDWPEAVRFIKTPARKPSTPSAK